MAPVLLKDLVFIDGGERIEFPAGTAVEVVDPETVLAADLHRLGLILAALAERRRRFRPGLAVRVGDRVRVVSARVISTTNGEPGGSERNRGPPNVGSPGDGAVRPRGEAMAEFSCAEASISECLPPDDRGDQ